MIKFSNNAEINYLINQYVKKCTYDKIPEDSWDCEYLNNFHIKKFRYLKKQSQDFLNNNQNILNSYQNSKYFEFQLNNYTFLNTYKIYNLNIFKNY